MKKRHIVLIVVLMLAICTIAVGISVMVSRQKRTRAVEAYNNLYTIVLCIYGQGEAHYNCVVYDEPYFIGPESYDRLIYTNYWNSNNYDISIIEDLAAEYEVFVQTGEPGNLIEDYFESYRLANHNHGVNDFLSEEDSMVIVHRIKDGLIYLENDELIRASEDESHVDEEYLEILNSISGETHPYISNDYYAAYIFFMNHMDEISAAYQE